MYEINSMLVLFFRVILNVFAIKMCVVVEKEMYIMEFFFSFFDNSGVPRFAGHSPGSGQTAVNFTREGFTWAGSNPVPLWCPEEAW